MRRATRSSTSHWSLRGLTLRSRYVVPAVAVVLTVSASLYAQQQTPFRSGASTVAVYTTVTDSTGPPGAGSHPGRLRDLRQRQAPADHAVCDRDAADHRHRDARSKRQHEGELQPRRRRRGGVRQAAAAGRQGAHRELCHKIQVDPEEFTERPQGAHRDPAQPSSSQRARRRCGTPPTWRSASSLPQDGRKVVLLFTDGVDSPGNFKTNNLSVMDVMDRATKEDVMIYAIGLESRLPYGRRQAPLGGGGLTGGFGGQGGGGMTQRPDPGLPKIAAETGGGYFELTQSRRFAVDVCARGRRAAPAVRARRLRRPSSMARRTTSRSSSRSRA